MDDPLEFVKMEEGKGQNVLTYWRYASQLAQRLQKSDATVDTALHRAGVALSLQSSYIAVVVDEFLTALAEVPKRKQEE